MKKRYLLYLVGLALAFAVLACTISPQLLISKPIDAINEEVATTISRVIIDDGDLPSLYREINPGVVAIRALTEEGGGLGTGFVWDEEGHIVTNFHVVQSATDLEVDFPSGFKTGII